MKTALLMVLWLATPGAFALDLNAANSEAVNQMRAGNYAVAEKVWDSIVNSAEASPDLKKSAKANLACLYQTTGRQVAGELLEQELGLTKAKTAEPPPIKSKPLSSNFHPLPLVTTPAARAILSTIKEQTVQEMRGRGVDILKVSTGFIYRLPGEHKALLCFDVLACADNTAQTVFSYSITVQDFGNGNIKTIDKKVANGFVEPTDYWKSKQRAEQEKIDANARAVRTAIDQFQAVQNQIPNDTEIEAQQDLKSRQWGKARRY